MNDSEQSQRLSAAPGSIEPHAPLLTVPPEDQLLYKIMSVENLLHSITGSYLYFNRVDSYADFPNADKNDGQQLPMDQAANATTKFEARPDYDAAQYYDQCRARTYACCFSTENSDYIWKNYANGSEKGKVCVVFEFGKLRTLLNSALDPEGAVLRYNGEVFRQIFDVNYGLVDYVDWDSHRANEQHLPNPIRYTYIKDAARFSEEKELRISLSAISMGHFVLKDGARIQFPTSLLLGFDFCKAIASTAIREILLTPDADAGFLTRELSKLRIDLAPSSGTT
ncbi:DUF2971 domain-containing protein [Parachitinimonas caeni]|uniref:DUF2971 domain-containing protein n=1 Tax=Parachitinimonas caeni TaxID=3031301 RepID=A0ABT7DW69_9NEIS|nr:DUF2971 domain-containing protein [Parachitinimonas caeni]MDK2124307.1 DUF2971 domain-containing protein [Parachitinimonas caeni]